jgi:hypothetical protein
MQRRNRGVLSIEMSYRRCSVGAGRSVGILLRGRLLLLLTSSTAMTPSTMSSNGENRRKNRPKQHQKTQK